MMKKARFTETQIVNILKLADSGMKVEDICRQNEFHISRASASVTIGNTPKTNLFLYH
ncbi:transposase [Providencia stuartii]|nr:transposase [Providencia stuartii]